MKRILPLVCLTAAVLAFSACKQKPQTAGSPEKPDQSIAQNQASATELLTFESSTCNGLTPDKLSPIVNIAPEDLEPKIEALDENRWACSYGKDAAVYFTVTVGQTTQECENALGNYHRELENMDKFLPQDQYPQGTHSNVKNTNFEGIRSEVTDSLTANKCNINVFVTKPEDKMLQVKIVEAFFSEEP